MQKLLTKNRWIILMSAVIVWTCTAFPSLWAIFQADAAATYGITLEESAMLFPMCTAFFGVFSIIGGRLQDIFPPNLVAIAGSVMMSTGVIMLSVLGEGTSVMTLYLCFSLPFGGGCGILSPALSASLMKWYADKKGFAIGLGGALSSLVMVCLTYISKALLNSWGMKRTVFVYGIVFMVLCVASCSVLINPTRQYIREKMAVAMANRPAGRSVVKADNDMIEFTSGEMLRTKQFYLLFLAGIFSGPAYMLIAPSIVTLGISRGLSENLAVSAVAIATGVSAIGKFIVPTLSDKIGRKKCAVVFTIFTLISSVLLMKAMGVSVLVVYTALVFTYSGWTMLIGPFVTDMFGNANAGANMGIVSLYSTISSVSAPMLVTLFTPVFAANTSHLIGIAGILLAIVCIVLLDPDTAKLKEE